MPKICYVPKTFTPRNEALVVAAADIVREFLEQGFDLTLRQLYYQFVSRDLLPNTQESYNRLGVVISDARKAGLIDWDAIVDRTRNVRTSPHWDSPGEIIDACALQFRYDLWADQEVRAEVWIEKDALVGVFDRTCRELDVPLFACRGYTSDSEIWSAAYRRMREAAANNNQRTIIFHFGDHDPSGIDMTRDVKKRLDLFFHEPEPDYDEEPDEWREWSEQNEALRDVSPVVRRVALNMDQVRKHKPPPNPAKVTDSRFKDYEALYGDKSWELDALNPTTLAALVRAQVFSVIDADTWNAAITRQDTARELLTKASKNWTGVVEYLEGKRSIRSSRKETTDEDAR